MADRWPVARFSRAITSLLMASSATRGSLHKDRRWHPSPSKVQLSRMPATRNLDSATVDLWGATRYST